MASALRYLHVERDHPVVHFNVSTDDVLIDQNGRGVLGSFSFSKVIDLAHPLNWALIDSILGTSSLRGHVNPFPYQPSSKK